MKRPQSKHDCNPRICFVSHDAYGAMTGGNSGRIGGVEKQTSLMSKWFAARGYETTLLTWNEGGPKEETINGVRVIKLCRQDDGIKGLRFFWPKWTSLIAAMKNVDADIYYHNLAECVTGQMALWCRRNKRKFIFSASSDMQCKVKLPYKLHERIFYRYGLKAADLVIVQTNRQLKMMQNNYDLDPIVLPMPCPGPNENDYKDWELKRNDSHRVLWIGKIYEVKRPDRLLDLAEVCPDMHFDVVGPSYDTQYAKNVCQRAKNLNNITLHGPVIREHVPDFYKKAKVMCCTSDAEGFPNTFLEAWSYALPIVSTFDPGGIIANKGLGIISRDISGLADGIRSLCESPNRWKEMSQKVHKYYLENHTVDVVMAKFERIFLKSLS